jgi:hypothetical protein
MSDTELEYSSEGSSQTESGNLFSEATDIESQSAASNASSTVNEEDEEENEREDRQMILTIHNNRLREMQTLNVTSDSIVLPTVERTITIDQTCGQFEVVDLESESDPPSRPTTTSAAAATANQDDEDVMILSENLNDTDVLHMPVLVRPAVRQPILPVPRSTQPAFRSTIRGIHQTIRGLNQMLTSDSDDDLPPIQHESLRPKRTLSIDRNSKKTKTNDDPSARSDSSLIDDFVAFRRCSSKFVFTNSSLPLETPVESPRPAVQCPICLDDMKAVSSKLNHSNLVCNLINQFCF